MPKKEKFIAGMKKIKDTMLAHDKKREQVIKQARQIQRESKIAIFSLQKDDTTKAKDILELNKKKILELIQECEHTSLMHSLGPAIEEYAEAQIFFIFLQNQNIPTHEELQIPYVQYIGGLCDFVGELVRYAYAQSFKQNTKFIQQAKEIADEIYAQLLELECKGDMRRKFDSVKYSIQKLEHLLFELNIAHMRA